MATGGGELRLSQPHTAGGKIDQQAKTSEKDKVSRNSNVSIAFQRSSSASMNTGMAATGFIMTSGIKRSVLS